LKQAQKRLELFLAREQRRPVEDMSIQDAKVSMNWTNCLLTVLFKLLLTMLTIIFHYYILFTDIIVSHSVRKFMFWIECILLLTWLSVKLFYFNFIQQVVMIVIGISLRLQIFSVEVIDWIDLTKYINWLKLLMVF